MQISLIIWWLILPSPSVCQDNSEVKVGSTAQPFSLLTIDGERVYLRDFCGEARIVSRDRKRCPVVLNFFSTTCKPCKEEIPQLHRLKNKYKDSVAFLLIAVGEPREKVREYLQTTNYTLPVLIDQYLVVTGKYGDPQLVPKLVLVDREGIIRLFEKGYKPENIKELDALLFEMTKTPH